MTNSEDLCALGWAIGYYVLDSVQEEDSGCRK